mmetsp:Transcript_33804/g.101041  ORF Transcript_33804/g.101041 Transcript_33804/m.101041 type:complete len:212 (+) Transcript_33804:158-793(+)
MTSRRSSGDSSTLRFVQRRLRSAARSSRRCACARCTALSSACRGSSKPPGCCSLQRPQRAWPRSSRPTSAPTSTRARASETWTAPSRSSTRCWAGGASRRTSAPTCPRRTKSRCGLHSTALGGRSVRSRPRRACSRFRRTAPRTRRCTRCPTPTAGGRTRSARRGGARRTRPVWTRCLQRQRWGDQELRSNKPCFNRLGLRTVSRYHHASA